jgi:glyoxylase-like metal-dependent hydrolase (beta-lactamase superfamily II)
MTYLVWDDSTNQATLIDPVYDFMDHYVGVLNDMNLTLAFAMATHTHADHITACFSLREQFGCEYVMWHSTACLGVSKYVNDGETIKMGETIFKFHHAPGHTNDSMLIETGDYVMTGDFLFTGSGGVGRDDLPSGRIRVHWDALDVLERLEGHLLVCTGHDPPGTEMQTLDWNRKNNPVLNMNSYDEYEAWQIEVSAGLGAVSKIKTAVPANLFAEIPGKIPWLD